MQDDFQELQEQCREMEVKIRDKDEVIRQMEAEVQARRQSSEVVKKLKDELN